MDGFINFFKEPGLTSNRALKKIKKITDCKKAGFLGTLDPAAAGILPVALGKGTKLFPYFEKMPKKYRATIIFGSETNTQDATGEITKSGTFDNPTKEKFEEALKKFRGEIAQVPPMFSAKKINGERLYRIARKGNIVEREEKKVTIHTLNLEEFGETSCVFTALVSRGVYIRTLCEDIGRELGCLAHMGALTREEAHIFTEKDSWTLDKLSENRDTPEKWLLPLDFPISFMPEQALSAQETKDLSNGLPIEWQGKYDCTLKLYSEGGSFFGIGKGDPKIHKILPEKILFPVQGKTPRLAPTASR